MSASLYNIYDFKLAEKLALKKFYLYVADDWGDV
jgi:hypothetical protein